MLVHLGPAGKWIAGRASHAIPALTESAASAPHDVDEARYLYPGGSDCVPTPSLSRAPSPLLTISAGTGPLTVPRMGDPPAHSPKRGGQWPSVSSIAAPSHPKSSAQVPDVAGGRQAQVAPPPVCYTSRGRGHSSTHEGSGTVLPGGLRAAISGMGLRVRFLN